MLAALQLALSAIRVAQRRRLRFRAPSATRAQVVSVGEAAGLPPLPGAQLLPPRFVLLPFGWGRASPRRCRCAEAPSSLGRAGRSAGWCLLPLDVLVGSFALPPCRAAGTRPSGC
jgi:hypothetical protein